MFLSLSRRCVGLRAAGSGGGSSRWVGGGVSRLPVCMDLGNIRRAHVHKPTHSPARTTHPITHHTQAKVEQATGLVWAHAGGEGDSFAALPQAIAHAVFSAESTDGILMAILSDGAPRGSGACVRLCVCGCVCACVRVCVRASSHLEVRQSSSIHHPQLLTFCTSPLAFEPTPIQTCAHAHSPPHTPHRVWPARRQGPCGQGARRLLHRPPRGAGRGGGPQATPMVRNVSCARARPVGACVCACVCVCVCVWVCVCRRVGWGALDVMGMHTRGDPHRTSVAEGRCGCARVCAPQLPFVAEEVRRVVEEHVLQWPVFQGLAKAFKGDPEVSGHHACVSMACCAPCTRMYVGRLLEGSVAWRFGARA
jgi:hypothetical protein